MSNKPKTIYKNGALTMRLIVGIFSILLSILVGFQSCFAGVGEALVDNGADGGSSGVILSFFMLAAGIIAIATRKSKGGTITAVICYALGGIIGATSSTKIYKDLQIWSVVAFIFAALLLISLFMKVKDNTNNDDNNDTEQQ